MARRMPKINSLMHRELSQIIEFEIKDPNQGFVTVMGMEVSKDLRHAKAFVSVMGDADKKEKGFRSLLKAKGFIQRELGSRLSMKYVPELRFILDDSLDHAMHIEEVLKEIKKRDEDLGEKK